MQVLDDVVVVSGGSLVRVGADVDKHWVRFGHDAFSILLFIRWNLALLASVDCGERSGVQLEHLERGRSVIRQVHTHVGELSSPAAGFT